jgi:heme-degrading monooxygenase HmoA
MAVYMYIWEFRVRPGREGEFRDAYGPDGPWVQLFRRASGYLRSELYRDRVNTNRFLTFDYWESEAAWRTFRLQFATEYQSIDARCEALTASESEIGRFEPVS